MRTVRSLFEAAQVIKQLQDKIDSFSKIDTASFVTKSDLQNALATLNSATTLVDDSSRFLKARVHNSANVSIPNATETMVTFDTEDFDFGDLHSTVSNTSRITAKKAGDVLLIGQVYFASNIAGFRQCGIKRNATDLICVQVADPAQAAIATILQTVGIAVAATNDYFELEVKQTSGGALNAVSPYTWLSMTYIR